MKNIPQRTCMGCNTKRNKNDLLRIVKNKENGIIIDITGKLEGRGAYICRSEECLNKFAKSKRTERMLGSKISEEIYNNLRGVIIDKQK